MARPSKHKEMEKRAADRAVMFINQLKHTKGDWYGKNFLLLPWQEKIVRDLFGTLKPDGSRQYNTAYIEVPKKAGNLKMTIPLEPFAQHQRYAHPDTEITQLSEEALLEFCKIPRRREDIYKHFAQAFTGSLVGFSHLMYPLINLGKLKRTAPIGNKFLKFVTA